MSLFPGVVWLKIYSYLNIEDRNRLSQSCKLVHYMFFDPFLWKEAVFSISLSPSNKDVQQNLNMIRNVENYKQRLHIFGKFLRNLTLIIKGLDEKKMKDILFHFIGVIIKKCNDIEKITIDLGKMTIQPSHRYFKKDVEFTTITHLTKTFSDTLHQLNLITWPCTKEGLLTSLITKNISHLSINHPRVNLNDWITINAITPKPSQIQVILSKLTYLTSLSLHCSCISNSLLKSLSPPSSSFQSTSETNTFHHFQHFHILMMFDEVSSHFYQIPIDTWQHLLTIHPSLLLYITIGNTIPKTLLNSFFHPSLTPSICSLTISKYARYSADLLTYIDASINFQKSSDDCDKNYNNNTIFKNPSKTHHNSKLQKVYDYSDSSGDLIQLTSFIQAFPLIDQLIYNGQLYDTDVISLVKMRKWRVFSINIGKVLISYPNSFDDLEGQNSSKESNDDIFFSCNESDSSEINVDIINNQNINDNNNEDNNNNNGRNDDDVVLFKDTYGNYQTKSLCDPNKGFFATHESEAYKEKALEKMMAVIQHFLRCPWRPINVYCSIERH